jgi:SpoVK/Ycf46/Vps4 family AAA+-type ATPase
MQPRHRVLLSGPPGNGKTSLAEAIAEAIAIPLFTVRYDALVGAYLGETNARLSRLFEYARTTPCVLLFDEFDAIGKERGDVNETGEIKRVVSFLLMQIDQLPSYVIAVAATNHAELLDRAVWRRFQLRIEMPAPDLARSEVLLARCFSGLQTEPGVSPKFMAERMDPANYAEVLDFYQNVRRRHILSQGGETLRQIVLNELDLWGSRVRSTAHGPSPRKPATSSKQPRR